MLRITIRSDPQFFLPWEPKPHFSSIRIRTLTYQADLDLVVPVCELVRSPCEDIAAPLSLVLPVRLSLSLPASPWLVDWLVDYFLHWSFSSSFSSPPSSPWLVNWLFDYLPHWLINIPLSLSLPWWADGLIDYVIISLIGLSSSVFLFLYQLHPDWLIDYVIISLIGSLISSFSFSTSFTLIGGLIMWSSHSLFSQNPSFSVCNNFNLIGWLVSWLFP